MSKADFYKPGDWNAACSMCGRKRKASDLVRNWMGMYRCKEHNEPRQPQDFVRGVPDNMAPPFVQPQVDDYVYVCTLNERSAYPSLGGPGCMIPGNAVHAIEDGIVAPVCDIYTIQGVPGWGGPGCAIPGEDPMAPVVIGPAP